MPTSAPGVAWTALSTRGSAPAARHGHATCSTGKSVYSFGGATLREDTYVSSSELHVLDATSLSWRRIAAAEAHAPPARCFSTLNVLEAGRARLILFGGAAHQSAHESSFNDVWLYKTDGGTWDKVATAGGPPPPRAGHSAVVLSASHRPSQLCVFGGARARFRTLIEPGPPACRLARPRLALLVSPGSCLRSPPSGVATSGEPLADLWLLLLPTSTWELHTCRKGVPRPSPRAYHSATPAGNSNAGGGGSMVVFGGRDNGKLKKASAWIFDLQVREMHATLLGACDPHRLGLWTVIGCMRPSQAREWTEVPPSGGAGCPPDGRSGHTAVAYKEHARATHSALPHAVHLPLGQTLHSVHCHAVHLLSVEHC